MCCYIVGGGRTALLGNGGFKWCSPGMPIVGTAGGLGGAKLKAASFCGW